MDWRSRDICWRRYRYCWCGCCVCRVCTSTHRGRHGDNNYLRLGGNPWYFYVEKNKGKQDHQWVIPSKENNTLFYLELSRLCYTSFMYCLVLTNSEEQKIMDYGSRHIALHFCMLPIALFDLHLPLH